MAKRSTIRRAQRRGGYRSNPYNAKAYKFTVRRKAALRRAQAISARKKKMNKVKVGVMAVGGVAFVGAGLYMGRNTAAGKAVRRGVADSVMRFHPERSKFSNLKKARTVVQPGVKEGVRMGGAVSPAGTPAQPGHIGATPAPYPHTPGAAAPRNPATYTRTEIPQVDHNALRQDMQDEDDYLKTAEGSLEKFISPGDDKLIKKLVAGQKVTKSEMRRALKKRNAAIRGGRYKGSSPGVSGGRIMTDAEIEKQLDRMVAGGHLTTVTRGKRTATRTNPKAVPHPTAPNSGMTQAEVDATLAGTELPIKPVLGTPTAKGGGRGVVKLPGAPAPAPYTVPGLGNAQSPFGTKVQETGLTRGQKAAMTRARNKAAKAAGDAKPAAAPTKRAQPAKAAASRPHSPSSAMSSDDWFATHKRRVIAPEAMVGKQISDWDKLLPVVQQNIQNMANDWMLSIDSSGRFKRGRH